MTKIVEFKDVSKEYITGKNILKAADNLNFTIDKGEFVVILGPSGSGKSTLLNLLGGLDNLTSGKITVDDEQISGYNEKQLTHYRAEKVGFIFQFYNLIPNLTAIENIELINDVIKDKIDGMKYLKQVDLAEHAHQFPSELSGGEQQRVSIARAISKQPALLLCDEPTGALDSKTGYNIINILLNLAHEHNSTVIIVTHNNQLSYLADRIIHLKNGQIEDIEINKNPKSIDQIEW
ncbi:MAG: macrolide ABC transporter ATP-binding protein [Methanosphaera sp. SHI613]|jgi:putative ABC transport system ATP-binding protein|nr:MAG: macrolide ABC transporter ATP-binding protein [Methanosphaera sp. SHI613]